MKEPAEVDAAGASATLRPDSSILAAGPKSRRKKKLKRGRFRLIQQQMLEDTHMVIWPGGCTLGVLDASRTVPD
jgi:hypothetical protein